MNEELFERFVKAQELQASLMQELVKQGERNLELLDNLTSNNERFLTEYKTHHDLLNGQIIDGQYGGINQLGNAVLDLFSLSDFLDEDDPETRKKRMAEAFEKIHEYGALFKENIEQYRTKTPK